MIDNKYLAKFGFELIVDLFKINKDDKDCEDYIVDMQAINNAILSNDKDIIIALNKKLSNKYPSIEPIMAVTGSQRVSDYALYQAGLEENIGNLIKIRWAINLVGSQNLVQKLLNSALKAGIETAKDYVEDKLIDGIMGEDAIIVNYLRSLDDLVSKKQKSY